MHQFASERVITNVEYSPLKRTGSLTPSNSFTQAAPAQDATIIHWHPIGDVRIDKMVVTPY